MFDDVRGQLTYLPGARSNLDTDRRWNNRQETLELLLEDFRHDYARGKISEAIVSEVEDLCMSHGLHVDQSGPSFRRLCKAYLTMSIEIIELQLKRQIGTIIPPLFYPISFTSLLKGSCALS